MEYIFEHKDWIFSGIGTFIIGLIIVKRVRRKKNTLSSTQVRSEGDIHIGDNKGNNDQKSETKNIVENSNLTTKGDFHLGDK